MKSPRNKPVGTCSRCGECCRWLPIIPVRQCLPHLVQYLRVRGLREIDGYFIANAPCQHLKEEVPGEDGVKMTSCMIYETRPATCRDFCGKALSGGKRYYVPAVCTMAGGKGAEPETTGENNSAEEN